MTSLPLVLSLLVLGLLGCSQPASSTPPPGAEAPTAQATQTAGSEQARADSPASAGSDAPSSSALDSALAGEHRSAENKARDRYRHPKETLEFFGLQPDMTVVELSPGGGWYTEVLAATLCPGGGKLSGTVPPLDGEYGKYAKAFHDRLAEDPEVFSCVEPVTYGPEHPSLGPAGSADMVLTFRSNHGWINRGQAEAVYKAAFEVLKPGGTLGVVQHRAADDADPKASAKQGYVPEPYVVELATKAGFELAARSDINRNPQDSHDHPEGVWTLPPTLRLEDVDREKYLAIGESDRMTLKFTKPAQEEPTTSE